jgi:hypothetical protein
MVERPATDDDAGETASDVVDSETGESTADVVGSEASWSASDDADAGGDAGAAVDPAADRTLSTLPEGWRVWNAETRGRVILAYRPDVFGGDAFPAACLPTIYVSNGSRRRRPGAGGVDTDDWHVTLFVEPDVEVAVEAPGDRPAALAAAVDVAARFAAGDVDYRAAYQVPRPEYLDELDRLTGREDGQEA